MAAENMVTFGFTSLTGAAALLITGIAFAVSTSVTPFIYARY